MTVESPQTKSAAGRKIWWLTIVVLVAVALYSSIWFYSASKLQAGLSAFLEERKAAGLNGECVEGDVRGFPFRIGYFCKAVRIDDSRRATSVSFGELRTAAQIYQPGHAIIELDGPAEIRTAQGPSVAANWDLLKASVVATTTGLDRTSLVYDKMAGTLLTPELTGALAFSADHGETHIRQNGADLDAALSVDNLDLKLEGTSLLRPVNSKADITIFDRADWLAGNAANPSLRNSRGQLRNAEVDLGDGMLLTVSGPFSVSADGLISGELDLGMKNISAWRTALSTSFPQATNMIDNAANMLTALGGGENDTSLKLSMRDGAAYIAFIKLGELPRL
ncbi:DUF2125 domain-containing protein [Pararhizobium sp.]|uniref:DUF2125 domain-containing protein n=1 Tax=Pararhizobium sp. TaxID=1977563 RepID=UPI00271F811F|nr:DUF2125 domain-containing protein [Pararhizobium sp.]MDO9417454.1 DUF2125 domain-containing protein [Pararhizobium sp.]